MARIQIELGDRSYTITVVKQDRGELATLLRKFASGARLFVVADAQVWALYGRAIERRISRLNCSVEVLTVPISERTKTIETCNRIQDFLLAREIARDDFILAVGGGITSDLVGFAASTVLRGVSWGVVVTSLMGMVDAAIGGKTGVNHRFGKNLIGSFWQPRFVFADLEFLNTLPPRGMVNGLGEIVKYAGIAGGRFLGETESYLDRSEPLDSASLYRLVSSSAALKAQIVRLDEREGGARAFLNLGHTFGHAIELCTGYSRIQHGEAVILGLLCAVSLSQKIRPQKARELLSYRVLVERAIRLVPRRRLVPASVLEAMNLDKKRTRAGLTFVLLERPGSPALYTRIPHAAIAEAVDDMITVYSKIGGTNVPHSRH